MPSTSTTGAPVASILGMVIRAMGAPVVLVDGIRGDYEVETFKEHFPGFTLIGIESSFETRYRRLTNRGRSDDSLTPEELRTRDERELGWGLGRALEGADRRVTNEGSLEEFSAEVRTLLCRLGGREE